MTRLIAILAIATVLGVGCRLANEIAWTMNKTPTPLPASPMLGSANVVPLPIPQPVPTMDWVSIIGIVAVQILTWWLGNRDRRKYHGQTRQVELKQYHPGGG